MTLSTSNPSHVGLLRRLPLTNPDYYRLLQTQPANTANPKPQKQPKTNPPKNLQKTFFFYQTTPKIIHVSLPMSLLDICPEKHLLTNTFDRLGFCSTMRTTLQCLIIRASAVRTPNLCNNFLLSNDFLSNSHLSFFSITFVFSNRQNFFFIQSFSKYFFSSAIFSW